MNAARRSIVLVTTAIVLVVVGLAGVFAARASAGPLVRSHDAVAPIAVPGGQIVGVLQPVLAGQHRPRAPDYDQMAVGSSVAAEGGGAGWTLPEGGGGAQIEGRWYTEHALERMAPDTAQVRAELEARALSRAEAAGLKPGTPEFGDWWNSYGPDPRGVPPSVVEAEITNPGSTNVRVITGSSGQVITVIPR